MIFFDLVSGYKTKCYTYSEKILLCDCLDLTDRPHTLLFNKFPICFLHEFGVMGALLMILRLPYLFLPVHVQMTTAMLASRKPSCIT